MNKSTMKYPHSGAHTTTKTGWKRFLYTNMELNETKNKLWNRVYSILLFVKEKQEDNTYLPVTEKINME